MRLVGPTKTLNLDSIFLCKMYLCIFLIRCNIFYYNINFQLEFGFHGLGNLMSFNVF